MLHGESVWGMDGSTQMGDVLSSAAHGKRITKWSHMSAPEGSSGDQGWLGNLDQQPGRIATSDLGAVGRRADMVGLGRSGYRLDQGMQFRGLGHGVPVKRPGIRLCFVAWLSPPTSSRCQRT